MPIDFTQKLADEDGKTLPDQVAMQTNGGALVELTLGRAASHAQCTPYQDEAN